MEPMSHFSFLTDTQSEQYCWGIIDLMMSCFDLSESEALQRMNTLWAGKPIVGEMDLIYHEIPEQWAKNLFYGHEQFWWLDERGLQSIPLEPAEARTIHSSSRPKTLLGTLNDPEVEVRAWAAYALGHERDEDPDDLINHALSHTLQHDAHSRVRYWAAHSLGKRSYDLFTPVITPALCAALTDSERGVRAQAAWCLANRREPMSVAPLLDALQDDEGCVRWRAAKTLGNLGDLRAVPALIGALKDSDQLVQKTALRALGKLGDARAVDGVIELLESAEDQQSYISFEETLMHLGAAVLPPLRVSLSSENGVARLVAIRVLGKLKDEQAQPALLHLLQTEPIADIRAQAAYALIEIGDVGVLDALLASLTNDESTQVREGITNMLLLNWSKKISPEKKKQIAAMRVTQKQRRSKKRREF